MTAAAPNAAGHDRGAGLLHLDEHFSLTYGSRAGGERVAGPHVHGHTEAFYVLEGALTFEVGAERETVTVDAGGFVAVPPGVVHAYGTAPGGPARWLIVHAPDGGFVEFMRGRRDGVEVEWDIGPVPPGGGPPVDRAIVSRPAPPPVGAAST